jgi:uncharacterized membrane protein
MFTKRIFAKTTTYGLMHIVIAFCVAWVVSGDLRVAIGISLIEPFIQIIGFGLHEHVWERIRPGSSKEHTPGHMCCADTEMANAVFKAMDKIRLDDSKKTEEGTSCCPHSINGQG